MCYKQAMKKRALFLVGAVIVSLVSASTATAEGLPVIGAEGGTSVLLAREGYEDMVRFDLTVSPDDRNLIEEYCTPSSSVLEVVYYDPTSSTASTGDAFVDSGSSGPRLFVATMWVSPSLPEGEVVELRPDVLLTCTRMAPGNLPDGFVQVKISRSTVVGFVPTYADLDPVDEASWTADTRLFQGLQSCVTAESSLVEVFSASFMVDNGRYYDPVTVVRDLGNNNAPVVELAIDDAMRALGSFEVRAICVTNRTAYEYRTVVELDGNSGAVTDSEGQVNVVTETPSQANLEMTPCPPGSTITVDMSFPEDAFTSPPTYRTRLDGDTAVVAVEGTTNELVAEVLVGIMCETATARVLGSAVVVFSAPENESSGSDEGSGADNQTTEEAAAELAEQPTGSGVGPESEAQPEPSTSGDTASGGTSSGGASSATPRFEVVPAPAPGLSDGGAGSPSPDSADTADEAGVASARLFDFDIERQAIIDASTGAIVGVYDEATGNFVSPTDDSLIAVIDPSNGEVTVLASGEVVARVLAAAGDDAGDDDSGDSGSNTLVFVLIGAAALLLVLLGVYWLGARQRGGPPSGTGAAAPAASPAPAAPADTPPVTQQTPLPPPPPPTDPGTPPGPPTQ